MNNKKFKIKNFIILFLTIIIFSCAIPIDNEFIFDDPKFDNMQEACEWIYKNIKYDSKGYDYWRMPNETLDEGKGDCADQSLLLMAIMKYQKGYDLELVTTQLDNGIGHAVVRYKGKYYDCTSNKIYNNYKGIILQVYDYNNAMYMAKYVKNY
jgi:hypothetical protein